MAFGFQNCCDSTDYFYVAGIPNTVSELEVYYIDTLEGLDFCAAYVEFPELFYQPLTFNLKGMTAQTDCTECAVINPCPNVIDIDIDNFNNYVTSIVNECSIITESFFEASCVTKVPSYSATSSGQIALQLSGGVPPYLVYSANTTSQLTALNTPGTTNYFLTNRPAGTYYLQVLDFNNNLYAVQCSLPTPPLPMLVVCNSTNVTVYNGNNGTILYPFVSQGTPPYTYWSGSTQITSFPITGLVAGTYNLTIKDSGTGVNFQQSGITCTIIQPAEPIINPSSLCMSFEFCGTGFLINFISAGTFNNRAYYTPNPAGNTSLGIASGMQLRWNGTSWTTTTMPKTLPVSLAGGCTPTGTNVQFVGPSSTQPMGSWTSVNGTFYSNDGAGNTLINVTSGSCTSSPLSVSLVTVNVLCNQNSTGSITLTVNNGTPPYIVYINGINNNGLLTKYNLPIGTYTWSVTDSLNRTATGTVIISQVPPSTISMSVTSTYTDTVTPAGGFNQTNNYDLRRVYNINISTTGLVGPQTIYGYFIVSYRQQAAYTLQYTLANYTPVGVIGSTFPIDSFDVYWKKDNVDINTAYSNRVTNSTSGLRTSSSGLVLPISANLLPSTQNNCISTPNVMTTWGGEQYTVGTQLLPIPINSSTLITAQHRSAYRFKPSSGIGCTPAVGEDLEIQFVLTNALPPCTILLFNGTQVPQVNVASVVYRRSSKSTGSTSPAFMGAPSNNQLIPFQVV
jgi:hypothetical protein